MERAECKFDAASRWRRVSPLDYKVDVLYTLEYIMATLRSHEKNRQRMARRFLRIAIVDTGEACSPTDMVKVYSKFAGLSSPSVYDRYTAFSA